MAKSKSGGTRAMIRGRVGSDVYSIGKDGMGKKQQVVRSLAEQVANPRTLAQMRGRAIMTTIMKAVGALRVVIDHSFDGMIGAQANVSEFIRVNYARILADIEAHPSSGNIYAICEYKANAAVPGRYVISQGKAVVSDYIEYDDRAFNIKVKFNTGAPTVALLKQRMNITSEDYLTLVGFSNDGKGFFLRVRLNPSLADDTTISAANATSVFTFEGNVDPKVTFTPGEDEASITVGSDVLNKGLGVILSQKANGGYIHSNTTIYLTAGIAKPYSQVIGTYPLGSEQFLNGGDVPGFTDVEAGTTSSSSGGEDVPDFGGGNG